MPDANLDAAVGYRGKRFDVMTRSVPSTYDDDFFAWTQDQAAALRQLPPGAIGNRVDIEHVAEEIEDLGKRDLREVRSFLARLLELLIKIDACSDSPARPHWNSETVHFHTSAIAAFSPSMRQSLDADKIWNDGRKAALRYVKDVGSSLSAPIACPFTLDELLSEDFDIDAALAKLTAAKDAT